MGAVLHLQLSPVAGSANPADNTSRLRIALTITTDWGTYNETGSTAGSITLDGAEIVSLDRKKVYYNTVTTLYDGVHTVSHNADGTRSVTVKASFDVDTSVRWIYAEKTAVLPSIPRSAEMTVPVFTLGQSGTLRVDCAEGLSYSVDYAIGELRGTAVSRGTGSAPTWTPPLALGRAFPNDAEGSGTLTISTWRGEEAVGSRSYPFTVRAGEALMPRITALTATPVSDNAAVQSWGVAVKGKSRIQYAVTASALEGATVESCSFACGGVSGSSLSGTTGLLTQAGTFTPRAAVVDSRGKAAAMEGAALTVYDYAPPALAECRAYRADAQGQVSESGNCIAVRATASCSSVGGRNSVALRLRYRSVGGSWSSYTALTAGQTRVLSGFSTTSSYEVEISAADALGESRTVSYIISTESVTFHLREGGQGAAFGKYAERDGWLESAWNMDLGGKRLAGLGQPAEQSDAVPLQLLEQRMAQAAAQQQQALQDLQQQQQQTAQQLIQAQQQLSQTQQQLSQTSESLSALQQQLAQSTVPDMVPGVEYATGEKWNGAAVYATVVDYGALPNNDEGENYTLAAGLNVIDIHGFAVGASYIIPIPGYYAVQNLGYTSATGNLWVSTTIDLSGYHGYITVKYTK